MIKDKWLGYDDEKWSNKGNEKKWSPNHAEKFLVSTVEDSTSAEMTHISFEYDRKTGKVNRISNVGEASNIHILIRLRYKRGVHNWVREYVISPDKDGEERLNIDIPMTVRDFFLDRDEDIWSVPASILITINETPKK